jgi:hypothetical protein
MGVKSHLTENEENDLMKLKKNYMIDLKFFI